MPDLPATPSDEPPSSKSSYLEPTSLVIDITVDEQVSAPINAQQLRAAVTAALDHRGFDRGQIGIRITDDPTIQQLNAKHLGHDYATDVISFGYVTQTPSIDGEMVVSIDTAREKAAQLGWATDLELCLYVVHGTLHITGMDDQAPACRQEMRDSEAAVMKALGIASIDRFSADRPVPDQTDSAEETSA